MFLFKMVRYYVESSFFIRLDSVLGWKPDDGRDLALSFEYSVCLSDVWYALFGFFSANCDRRRICVFQRRPPEYEYFGGHVKIALPETVDTTTIPVIESSLQLYSNFNGLRQALVELILEQGYIPKLLEQARKAIELNEEELLGSLFHIFRMLILMNSAPLFERLFSAEAATDVARVFEAEPGIAARPDYASFLQSERSRAKRVIQFEAAAGLDTLIAHTIRMQYFKDVILPRHLDDETYSSLNMLVRSHLNEIINIFDAEPRHYERLAELLLDKNVQDRWVEVCKFFRDFLAICRVSNLRQVTFFQSPVFSHLLGYLQAILASTEPARGGAAALASELLLSLVQLEGQQVQSWMRAQVSQPIESQLLSVVIDRLHRDMAVGVRWHMVSILRLLLDPPNPMAMALCPPQLTNFEAFSDYFYANHCIRLIAPFSELDRILKVRRLADHETDLYFHLCELTSTFVLLHKYKIKYQLVRDHCLLGISLLLQCHSAHVRLAAVRVFRTLVSVRDEFYSRIMITNRVLDQLMIALDSCAHRNNLLRAALLDFFMALHTFPCKRLIDELVVKHRNQMEQHAGLHDVFPRLIQLYDSNYALDESQQNGALSDTITGIEATLPSSQDSPMLVDSREEDYFSSADDDNLEMPTMEPSVPAKSDELPFLPLPSHKPRSEDEEEEFGGALGGTINSESSTRAISQPTQPSKKISFFGANLKNTLKTGFGLFRPKSTEPAPSDVNGDGGEDASGSPSKKTKHTS